VIAVELSLEEGGGHGQNGLVGVEAAGISNYHQVCELLVVKEMAVPVEVVLLSDLGGFRIILGSGRGGGVS
jgi:hypothetical protein